MMQEVCDNEHMNNLTLDELKEHIKAAQKWASDLSETWAGTLAGGMIERESNLLRDYTELEKWDLAHDSMIVLAELCHHVEEEMERQND